MNDKIEKVVKSQLAKDIADSVKHAAINMAGALLVAGAYQLGKKVVTLAADAVLHEAEKVD